MRLRHWIGSIGLLLATQACVVHDNTPVNPGYGYGYAGPTVQASATVGTASPYYVSSMPPEPLYEQMSASPGFGYVWIDGYWHWNGYEWVWVGGRWERQMDGYVYVQPYYDYVGGSYVYTPGYWSTPERVPHGWGARDHRDGRPTVVGPPPGWHSPVPPPHPGGVAEPGGPPRGPVGGGVRPPVDTGPGRPGGPIGPRPPTTGVVQPVEPVGPTYPTHPVAPVVPPRPMEPSGPGPAPVPHPVAPVVAQPPPPTYHPMEPRPEPSPMPTRNAPAEPAPPPVRPIEPVRTAPPPPPPAVHPVAPVHTAPPPPPPARPAAPAQKHR